MDWRVASRLGPVPMHALRPLTMSVALIVEPMCADGALSVQQ